MDNHYEESKMRMRNAAMAATLIFVGASLCFYFNAPFHWVVVIGSILQALIVYGMKNSTLVLMLAGVLVLLTCSDLILLPLLTVPGELAIDRGIKFRVITEWLAVITFYVATGVGIFARAPNPTIGAHGSGSKEF